MDKDERIDVMGKSLPASEQDSIRRSMKAKQKSAARKGHRNGDGELGSDLSRYEERLITAKHRITVELEAREEESRKYVKGRVNETLKLADRKHEGEPILLRVFRDEALAAFDSHTIDDRGPDEPIVRFTAIAVGPGLYRKLYFEASDLSNTLIVLQSRDRSELWILKRREPLDVL